ncbi:MAG: GNAT family N-acetyltransferase [Bdellovibrionota bacterium]|nr:MAG: GNAT family N-acetyltransferase [Bdellovibrionota bacterium]
MFESHLAARHFGDGQQLPRSISEHHVLHQALQHNNGAPSNRPSAALSCELLDLSAAVRAGVPRAVAMLGQYYPLFCEAFPDPDTRSTFEECLRDLRHSNFHIQVVVANGQVVGGLHWWLIDVPSIQAQAGQDPAHDGERALRLGVEEHIWVDRTMRGLGVGHTLDQHLRARLRTLGADAVLSELKNPFTMELADRVSDLAIGQSPEARLRFFQRQGRLLLNASYKQLALRADAAPLDGMVLTVEPLRLGFLEMTRSQYRSFLREYFSRIRGTEYDIEADPTYRDLVDTLVANDDDRIPFVELDETHLRMGVR